MLRVLTDRKGEIVALKFFRPESGHIGLLTKLIADFDKDRDLRNFPLPCIYEQGSNTAGRDGHIPLFRIVLDLGMIRHLNPGGW